MVLLSIAAVVSAAFALSIFRHDSPIPSDESPFSRDGITVISAVLTLVSGFPWNHHVTLLQVICRGFERLARGTAIQSHKREEQPSGLECMSPS